MAIPSMEQIEKDLKARLERMLKLRQRARQASLDASHAVALNKDRDSDALCEVVKELSRIVELLVEEAA